jgi:hypothetical protein
MCVFIIFMTRAFSLQGGEQDQSKERAAKQSRPEALEK